jgi:nucleotide-binding universal stress UspA family protein
MKQLRHILVPVDFSDPSREALLWAAELAGRYQARLTLLNVYPVPGYVLPDGFVAASPEVLSQVEHKTLETLEEWAAPLRQDGTQQVDVATAVGPAASEVVRWADSHGADLIVMGAHGRSGIALFFLGSTTDKVVRQAHCPVFVVPGLRTAAHRGEPRPAPPAQAQRQTPASPPRSAV